MQKRRLTVFLFLLLPLFLGAAIAVAQNNKAPDGRNAADDLNLSQGGIYTLHSRSHTMPIAVSGQRRPLATQPMQGGEFRLISLNADPVSQMSSQPAQAVTAVVTHTHSVNPGAFLYDEDSTDITMSIYYGLRWAANPNERAGFYMARPADWDGESPVQARITFAVGNGDAGTVNWRLRLNSYTPNNGEWLTNPGARDADQIRLFNSGSSLRIYDQVFTLQPGDFNDEPYWSFFFTRGDGTNGETFTGNLYVMGVDVLYGASTGTDFLYLPIVIR